MPPYSGYSSSVVKLTRLSPAAFKSVVDVDQSEVVSFWMIQLHVAPNGFCLHTKRGLHKAAWS